MAKFPLYALSGYNKALGIFYKLFVAGKAMGIYMLKHKGTQTIYTNRLILRKIREEDYEDMYRYTVKEEVARYVTWSVHKSIEDTKAICKIWASEYENGEKYHWAIVYNNRVIGNIEIVKIVDTTAFLGWQIDSAYWNKGIMTEAATAVRDYMFSQIGIEALEAEYMKENIGSGRVMQKIGMKEIPILESLSYQIRQKTEVDGIPIICYKLTKEEWEKRN